MLRRILTLLVLIFFSSNVFGQSDYLPDLNFTGNGARAAAMGYAFTGLADDATAISWNPAGLAQLYSMEASVVGRFGSTSIDFTGVNNPPVWERSTPFQLNFASLVFPFHVGDINIVGGVAYKILYDWDEEEKYKWGDWITPVGLTETINSEGGVVAISPSLGIEISDMFLVGTTVNIITGSNTVKYKNNFGDSFESEEEEYSGVGVDIGILVKPNDILNIGANLNLPYDIEYTADSYEGTLDVPFFFSVGAAAHITDEFTIAFDYQSRAWSESKLIKEAIETYFNEQNVPETNIDVDLNSIHFGLEYLLSAGNIVIPLRAGYFNNPIFSWDTDLDQIVNNVFTFGAGLVMGNIIIDSAVEIENLTLDYASYTQEETSLRITIGSTIHFGN